MGMTLLVVAAAGFLVWYLVQHRTDKGVWPWVGLGLAALLLVCSVGGRWFGGGWGRMGRGMMSRGMMGPGMMGRGFRQGPGLEQGPGLQHMALGTWWWVPLAIQAALAIGLVVLAVVVLRRYLKQQAEARSPLGILKARLARGEITVQEYEELRSKIG